jgi:hypothetical protein
MKSGTFAACLIVSTLCVAGQAAAKSDTELPAGVRPLGAHAVAALYADKTVEFPDARTGGFKFYFAPDHTIAAYAEKGSSVGAGRWSVADNQMCMVTRWRTGRVIGSRPYRICYAWFTDGSAYWTRVTRGPLRGHVYKGDAKLVSNGDQVSARIKHAIHR